MADITKCYGKDCTLKEKCYRFTAATNEQWQYYFTEPPFKDGKCDMYWGENQEQIFNQLKDITK